jgi:hypothetical protein
MIKDVPLSDELSSLSESDISITLDEASFGDAFVFEAGSGSRSRAVFTVSSWLSGMISESDWREDNFRCA